MSYVLDHQDVTRRVIDAGWTLPDGWTVTATIQPDYDTTPDEFDCYSPRQIAAWRNDEWQFVVVTVTVLDDHGREWGWTALGGVEHGWLTMTDDDDNVTGEFCVNALADEPGEYSVIREHDMIREALEQAVNELEQFDSPQISEPAGVTVTGL